MLAKYAQFDAETNLNSTQSRHVVHCEGKICRTYEEALIGEEPLSISVEGRPYSVVMRTPGEEIFHVAGFCLAEGLVDQPEDFASIGYCDQANANVASATLQPARRTRVAFLLKRRGFISQTSCGVCGKEWIDDLCQILAPITDRTRISMRQALECVNGLPRHQCLYEKTWSSHAAMLFDSKLAVLGMAEDVGRHNALDKTIGKVFMRGQLEKACLCVLSSRISYELVQKAARARVATLISLSRPTAFAVTLGRALNMTLACLSKGGGLLVFCGEHRLVGGSNAGSEK